MPTSPVTRQAWALAIALTAGTACVLAFGSPPHPTATRTQTTSTPDVWAQAHPQRAVIQAQPWFGPHVPMMGGHLSAPPR